MGDKLLLIFLYNPSTFLELASILSCPLVPSLQHLSSPGYPQETLDPARQQPRKVGRQIVNMGIFDKKPNAEATAIAQEEAPQFERVEWRKDPGLRKLYFYAAVLCVASATTGYDG